MKIELKNQIDTTKWDDKELRTVHKSFLRAKDMNSRMLQLYMQSSAEMKKRGLK